MTNWEEKKRINNVKISVYDMRSSLFRSASDVARINDKWNKACCLPEERSVYFFR